MRCDVRRAALALACTAAVGCGTRDPLGRRAVTGGVTFRGEPLARGTIEFLPTDPAGGAGCRGLVRDGRFAIPREQGVPAGHYRVAVSSPEPSDRPPVVVAGQSFPRPGTDAIPPAYNRDTRLTADVSPAGKAEFLFTLE